MKNYLVVFTLIISLFTSCSGGSAGSGDDAVHEICDCMLEAGLQDEHDLKDLANSEKKTKEIIKCVLPILKDVRDELGDMKDDERSEYFGDVLKEAVDCECGQNLLLAAAKLYDTYDVDDEFEDMIDDMEHFLGKDDEDYDVDYFGPSVDICDCVNMYQGDNSPSEEMIEACEELTKEFENMSSTEQEELMEIVSDCLDNY